MSSLIKVTSHDSLQIEPRLPRGRRKWRRSEFCIYILQGGFFYCSAQKTIKCQTLRKFWHLKLFDGIYYVIWHIFLGGTVKRTTLYTVCESLQCNQWSVLLCSYAACECVCTVCTTYIAVYGHWAVSEVRFVNAVTAGGSVKFLPVV